MKDGRLRLTSCRFLFIRPTPRSVSSFSPSVRSPSSLHPTLPHPAPRSSIHSRRSLITSREADGERRLGRRTEPRTRRGEDMRANQGSRIWILQITVYYKELLTINCQGTNHPRSILSFMDISILYLMVRSLLVTTGSTLFACGSFLSPSVPVRDRREEGPDRRGNVHRSRKKPSEVRWMTKRLEHDRSEGRRTEPLGTRRNPRD